MVVEGRIPARPADIAREARGLTCRPPARGRCPAFFGVDYEGQANADLFGRLAQASRGAYFSASSKDVRGAYFSASTKDVGDVLTKIAAQL